MKYGEPASGSQRRRASLMGEQRNSLKHVLHRCYLQWNISSVSVVIEEQKAQKFCELLCFGVTFLCVFFFINEEMLSENVGFLGYFRQ